MKSLDRISVSSKSKSIITLVGLLFFILIVVITGSTEPTFSQSNEINRTTSEVSDASGIKFIMSRDSGKNFTDPIHLISHSDMYLPSIATFNDNVYVVWRGFDDLDAESSDVFYTSSSDGGQTFGKPAKLNNDTLLYGRDPT